MGNNLKITALLVCINEEDYIWWALRSIYDVVDHIIVVEGVARNMWNELHYFTPEGLSTDRTYDEIHRLIREMGRPEKIQYIQYGFANSLNTLRDISLQACPHDTDYCLVVDADHLYDANEIMNLCSLCENRPNIRNIYAEQLMFFTDMHHILTVSETFREHLGYYLPHFFFRYQPELKYYRESPHQAHTLGPGEWLHPRLKVSVENLEFYDEDVAIWPPIWKIWHFGWVRKGKRLEQHILRASWAQINRVEKQSKIDPEKLTGKDKQYWLPLVGKTDKEVLEWQRMFHKIWTGLYDEEVGERLLPYEGKYPLGDLIKQHPFWGKNQNWFGGGEI